MRTIVRLIEFIRSRGLILVAAANAALYVCSFYTAWIVFYDWLRVTRLIPLILLIGLVIPRSLKLYRKEIRWPAAMELVIASLVLLNCIIQLTGPIGFLVGPLNYILSALAATFVGIPLGLLAALLYPALETAKYAYSDELFQHVPILVAHIPIGIISVFSVGWMLNRAKKEADSATLAMTTFKSDVNRMKIGSIQRLDDPAMDTTAASLLIRQNEPLTKVAELGRMVLEANTCIVMITTGGPTHLRIAGFSTKAGDFYLPEVIETAQHSLLSTPIEKKQPLLLDALSWRNRKLPWYSKTESKSFMAVPVLDGQEVIGLICADSPSVLIFDRESAVLLQELTYHVRLAISNARAFHEIDTEKTQFAHYYDIIKGLASVLKVTELGETILDKASELIPYDNAFLAIPSGDGCKILAARGIEARDYKWAGFEFHHAEGLTGLALSQIYNMFDCNFPMRPNPYQPVVSRKIKMSEPGSIMLVSLAENKKPIAAVAFMAKATNAFPEYSFKLIEMLCFHASTAMIKARLYEQMEEMATTDALTGCFNRRSFQHFIADELARAKRKNTLVSLILSDIDHFKKVNDTYGHPVGDIVLKYVAAVMQRTVREVDKVARIGGEEFAIILLDADPKGAKKFAERLRREIEKAEIPFPNGKLSITISLGIASFPDDGQNKEELINLADAALYYSKENGRNRVTLIAETRE